MFINIFLVWSVQYNSGISVESIHIPSAYTSNYNASSVLHYKDIKIDIITYKGDMVKLQLAQCLHS